MSGIRWRSLVALAIGPALAGCELTEVITAEGEDVLVVSGVLRPDRETQRVLLHHTVRDGVVRGEPGAMLRISRGGESWELVEVDRRTCTDNGRVGVGEDTLHLNVSCYVSHPAESSWVEPAGTYTLDLRTRDGRRVRGRTQVPGAFDLVSVAHLEPEDAYGLRSCALPPGTPLELTWSRASGAWAYLIEMEVSGLREALAAQGIPDIPEPLELIGVSVSESDTSLTIPTNVGVFDRFSLDQRILAALQGGFPSGVQVKLVVAAADRNFVNSVRGGAFNPSGAVYAPSVVGDGVGSFGSLVTRTLLIAVTDEAPPDCFPGSRP